MGRFVFPLQLALLRTSKYPNVGTAVPVHAHMILLWPPRAMLSIRYEARNSATSSRTSDEASTTLRERVHVVLVSAFDVIHL